MKCLLKNVDWKDSILFAMGILGGMLGGSIAHDIIVNTAAHKGEEITTFPLGFIIGMVVLVVGSLVNAFRVFTDRFDLCLTMGCTRKEFFRNELIHQALRMTLAVLVLLIGSKLEMMKCRSRFPAYRCELDITSFCDWRVMVPLGVFLLGLIFFNGGIALRFYREAFIVSSLFWILFGVTVRRLAPQVEIIIDYLSVSKLPVSAMVSCGMVLVGLLLIAGSWLFVRRQDVRI